MREAFSKNRAMEKETKIKEKAFQDKSRSAKEAEEKRKVKARDDRERSLVETATNEKIVIS